MIEIKSVYVVIPVHNRIHMTRSCLESLSHQTYRDFHVIVIDDGSTDGTSQMVKTEYPNVTLLTGDGNLWWTGATNKGCRYALDQGAAAVLTLNDDLYVAEDYIRNMWEAHIRTQNAVIGSLNLSQEIPPRVLFAGHIGHNLFSAKTVKRSYPLEIFNGQYSGLLPSLLLPGRGTLIPQKVFHAIGLFDNRFPQYGADFEFSMRALRAGFGLYVNADSPVYSPVSGGEKMNERGEADDLGSFLRSFFNFRSSNHLPTSWRFCRTIFPKQGWIRMYMPIYFIMSQIRKFGSFFRRKLA